jgi:hypothetical protein
MGRRGFWLEIQKEKDQWKDLDLEVSIDMNLKDIGWGGIDWVHLANGGLL